MRTGVWYDSAPCSGFQCVEWDGAVWSDARANQCSYFGVVWFGVTWRSRRANHCKQHSRASWRIVYQQEMPRMEVALRRLGVNRVASELYRSKPVRRTITHDKASVTYCSRTVLTYNSPQHTTPGNTTVPMGTCSCTTRCSPCTIPHHTTPHRTTLHRFTNLTNTTLHYTTPPCCSPS